MAGVDAQEADFGDGPAEMARRWKMELDAARAEVEKWHAQGGKIIKRFRDEQGEFDVIEGNSYFVHKAIVANAGLFASGVVN
jgi:hypothetical protein